MSHASQLSVVPYMEVDVTHVVSFTRLPLFSHATLKKKSGSLGTRLYKPLVQHGDRLNYCSQASISLLVNRTDYSSLSGIESGPAIYAPFIGT